MKKSKTLKWSFISIGGIGMLLISFTFIYDLLIPDICYYHTNEMNSLMKLFYSTKASDNGHLSPNLFNFTFSLFTGGMLGFVSYKILTKKEK